MRSDNRINLIRYAVCEMFKFAVAEGMWDASKLHRLFELAPEQNYGPADRRHKLSASMILRRRHRLRPRQTSRRDAPVSAVKTILGECRNSRDLLFVAMLATTGLRRGEALGLRLSDLHFLPTSTSLGCPIEGPHLHVMPRANSNQARVKNEKPRVALVTAGLVNLYERTARTGTNARGPGNLSRDMRNCPVAVVKTARWWPRDLPGRVSTALEF